MVSKVTDANSLSNIDKVPKELTKLQQDVELAIDCFFVIKHVFFTPLSTKICFTTIIHITSRNKNLIWVALKRKYMMYFLRGFHIVVITPLVIWW